MGAIFLGGAIFQGGKLSRVKFSRGYFSERGIFLGVFFIQLFTKYLRPTVVFM